MNLLKNLFLSFVLLFAFSDTSTAQIKSFSADSVKFVQEMGDFLVTARKKEGEDFMRKEFIPVFYSGRFTEKDKQRIYSTCNIMLKKRMKPFPDFVNYLTTMMNFLDSKQSDESFEAWQKSLEKIIENSTSKKFVDYLSFSEKLFSENILFQSSNLTWYSDNENYKFEFDSLPYVVFKSLNLSCYSKGDSAVIYNTKGILYPTEGKWIGQGGKVNWLRTGFDDESVYATLKNYDIALKTAAYTADSVLFYNANYFEKPLLGRLEERIMANVTEKNATYPKFESYNKRFRIKNLVEDVDYDGGFSMVGPKFIGAGSSEEDALLIFHRDKKPFIVAASKVFIIRKERISSDRSSICIYLDNDSIFHPGLNFKFMTADKELILYRDGKGMAKSPYYNTYHSIDMDVELVTWKMGDPLINMEAMKGSTQTNARFESSNYYSYFLYQKLMGMDATHPLVLIREASKKFDSRELWAEDIAKHMRFPLDQVAPLLLNLSTQGFLQYDVEKQKVVLKDKLFWYLEANAKKRDYDVIEFNSDIGGKPNATLSLLNFDLNMRGVKEIFLSDSQNVYIRPMNRELIMKRNRDFLFGGSVHAGLFDFYGKEFSFEYDAFKINLINVDSLSLKVRTEDLDDYGKPKLMRVKTVIQDIKGDLLIDGPNNKSGLKQLHKYPILNSRQESHVYYDRKDIQNGAYTKDKFYFKVYPFTLDSLNTFDNNTLAFKGLFVSAGIFPDFEEDLTLQPDYSLGFVRKAGSAGMPLYGGKAIFENDIKMSHEGLKGDGDIKYLTSIAKSRDFTFFPDSVTGLTQQFSIEERKGGGVEYPEVAATGAFMSYKPYKDLMEIEKKTSPIKMFKDQAESHGTLFLQPSGLSGKGLMTFNKAEMVADLYKFKNNEFFSDTADFRLASLTGNEYDIKTENLKAHIDFTEKKAHFQSNGGGEKVEFGVVQYICFMDEFTWLMDEETIEVSSSETAQQDGRNDLDLSGSKFISIHPQQDSLTYYSPKTKYDRKENTLYSSGVKYFQVADAMVYPDKGEVVVEKRAKMRTLENAKITANYITKYHNLYDATVNVDGRKRYRASANYDYVDEFEKIQTIHFNNIIPDTTGQTRASGLIAENVGFTMSSYFDFRGGVALEANKEFLTFNGSTRINHSCEKLGRNWMRFSSEINPKEIYIPVSVEPVSEDEGKLATGMLLATDSIGIYSAFLSKKLKPTDYSVITADGYLFYDKPSQEYRISTKEKLNENILPGNYISLNTNDCKFFGEGKMSFGCDLGNIQLKPAGQAVHNLINNQAVYDVIFSMNFFFDESALEKMADQMQKSSSADAVDYTRKVFEKSLGELLGKETSDKLISQLNLNGGSYRRFPSELNHSIFFTDVKFKWYEDLRSYRSMGKVGIGNIYKNQINRKFDGHIEIIKKRGGDIFNMYIDLGGGAWYFFNYQKNIMQVISSNEDFNNIIKNLKTDKKKYKNQKGEAPFSYTISTVKKKNDFLRKMESSEQEKETE
jgi:hypothetical protein